MPPASVNLTPKRSAGFGKIATASSKGVFSRLGNNFPPPYSVETPFVNSLCTSRHVSASVCSSTLEFELRIPEMTFSMLNFFYFAQNNELR